MLVENNSSRLALKQQLLLGTHTSPAATNRSPRHPPLPHHQDDETYIVTDRYKQQQQHHRLRNERIYGDHSAPHGGGGIRTSSPVATLPTGATAGGGGGGLSARVHSSTVGARGIKSRSGQMLNSAASIVPSSVGGRIEPIRQKFTGYGGGGGTRARDGSWNRPSSSRHHHAIPLLLDSDDSAQIARPFAAPMDEPLSPFPGANRVHSRENGGHSASKGTLDLLREPDRRTRGLVDSTGGSNPIDLQASGSAIAEARAEAAARKKRFSPGDRLAYIAERLDFQASRQGTAYYALALIGDGRQVIIHGGQFGSIPMLDVESATNEAFRWRWERSMSRQTIDSTAQGDTDFPLVDENFETPPLVGHSMICYKGSRLFIYGGCGPQVSGLFSQVYAANLKNGTSTVLQTSTPQPPGRARHACVLWDHYMVIHGGHCHRSGTRLLNDMWALNLNDTTWERWPTDAINVTTTDVDICERKSGPGARYGHHLATYREYIYLALGSDGGSGLNDIWAYHTQDKYWNFIVPRGKAPDARVDCAASTFGNEKWLFHGGLDSSSGTMLNSFYEFNFRTHEGRILRVELAVSPLKILPALMGHRMACMRSDDGRHKLVIFGGINRQSTIVHVVYAMDDTGKSPGMYNDTVPAPEVQVQVGSESMGMQGTPRAVTTTYQTTPLTTTGELDTPLLTTCNREPDTYLPMSPSSSINDASTRRLLRDTQEENKRLKTTIVELEKRLALYPNMAEIAALIASTDDAIDHLLKVRNGWQDLFHHLMNEGSTRDDQAT